MIARPNLALMRDAPTVPRLDDHAIHIWRVPVDGGSRRAARVALLALLSAYLDRTVDGSEIELSPTGKPELAAGLPRFNISHSGELALIAFATRAELGIDIERPSIRPRTQLADRICSAAEREWLARQADPDSALLRLWVRKEATVKAAGTGIVGMEPLRALDVLGDMAPGDWRLHDLPAPAPGYRAAIAHGAPADVALVQLRFGDL